MKKNIKISAWLFLFFASGAVLLALLAVFQRDFTSFSVRFPQKAVEGGKAEELQSEVPYLEITLWSSPEKEIVEAVSLGKKKEMQVIFAEGDIKKIMPMKLVFGMYLLSEDEKGCMIEETAAYNLFGNKNVLGKVLEYQDQKYVIRGVIKTKQNVCIFRSIGKNIKYENMELTYDKDILNQEKLTKDETAVSMQLLSQFEIKPELYFDSSFLAELLKLLFRLSAALVMIYQCLRRGYQEKKNSKKGRRKEGFYFLAAFLFLPLIFYGAELPDRLIPTRWSDFQFWQTLFEYYREYMEIIQSGRWAYKEQLLLRYCLIYGCSLLLWLISLWKLLSAFLRKIEK